LLGLLATLADRPLADCPLAGRSLAGRSLAGRSLAGRSLAGRSLAGRSLASAGRATDHLRQITPTGETKARLSCDVFSCLASLISLIKILTLRPV